MPVDFHLSNSEAQIREQAAGFAQHVLKPAKEQYRHLKEQSERYQALKPTYEAAVAGGMLKGLVSPALGGAAGSLVEAAILSEECYAVEPAAALNIFATGLGLAPLNIVANPETKSFVEPFLSGKGAPVASLVFSEPEGCANWLEKGGPGLQTTARKEGDEWILNGEKIWACSSAGWDFKGADLGCVVCRDVTEPAAEDSDPKDKIMILLVTRADIDANPEGSFKTLRHPQTIGHLAVSGPHIQYTNLRVPAKNVLCQPGTGVDVVMGSFDFSGTLVGAMSVGIMRAAFEAALDFAKKDDRRGAVPLLERQAFADILSGIKMSIEACRALTWKAAHALHNGPGDYASRHELALSAKIYCSEACVKAVTDAIYAVGITAYDTSQPFSQLLNDAMVLPIFDGGNIGMRRRHLQALMQQPTYDPWAATYGPQK